MGMSDHTSTRMMKDEWLTPPGIIKSLGEFDLDPCAPVERPWDTAKKHYTMFDDGLSKEWNGRVWCNPPYGRETAKWLSKLADHGSGIALIFARTETKMFFSEVWGKADSVLFIEGRLTFHNVDGTLGKSNAGAPSVLVAYGLDDARMLSGSGIRGKYLEVW